MKIYSRKILWQSILIGGAGAACGVARLCRGDAWGAGLIAVFCVHILQGVAIATRKASYEKYVRDAEASRRAYRARFGRLAPVMPYAALICALLALVCALTLPGQVWLALGLFCLAPVVQIATAVAARRKAQDQNPE